MEIYLDKKEQKYQKPKEISADWRISGYALVRSVQGNILMVQSTWNKKWELPGGGIKINESISDGIKRECYEETGYRIEINGQPIYLGESNFYEGLINKFYKSIIIVFTGRLVNKTQDKGVINTFEKDEIAKVKWVDPSTLKESNVHHIVWPMIRSCLSGK